MSPTIAEKLATLAQSHQTLIRLTLGLPEPLLDARPTPDDWSIREILAHLVDDEMYVMRTRLERIIKEPRPHLAPHDEKQWYATRNTTRDALPHLLADFGLQRAASLGILTMLRPSDWAREGFQPEYGTFTAAEWLDHWVAHDLTHIAQIEQTIVVARQRQDD